MDKNKEEQLALDIGDIYKDIIQNKKVKEGLSFIKEDHENTIREQKEICSIPSPTFKEEVRGKDFFNRLKNLGLENVVTDEVGNVFGIRKGAGLGPKLLIAAHLDTVFDENTDTTVKERYDRLYAPGISDDTRGLAELLSIIRAFNKTEIETVGDIIFLANVGEEGLGNLKGIKHFFKNNTDIDGFISIDILSSGLNGITYIATGSRRYKVTFNGPGGHSLGDFGLPSAIHAMGRAISKIADIQTPVEPKTTFTVGKIGGGTSINSIASEANMYVDMRSNSSEELSKLEAKFLDIVKEAAREENNRWNYKNKITVDIELIGDRPAGNQKKDAPIVQAAIEAMKSLGLKSKFGETGSTDANLPLSLGIPSITINIGGTYGNVHTLNEWFDSKFAHIGPQKTFLTALGLVGINGVTNPILKKIL